MPSMVMGFSRLSMTNSVGSAVARGARPFLVLAVAGRALPSARRSRERGLRFASAEPSIQGFADAWR
jgi:hypothetical protein